MSNQDHTLRPATIEEVRDTLSFALRFSGRKRVHHADDIMAEITAERLAEHMARSGLVIMKRPADSAHSTTKPQRLPDRHDD